MGFTEGLTSAEVRERIAAGQVNSSKQRTSRSYGEIVVKNVCTGFNLLLFILGAAFIVLGILQNDKGQFLNALATVGIIVMNILIATAQEIKAKRRLDRIALLLRPKVTVVRDGIEVVIDQADVVKDDVVVLRSGDQALVDGDLTFDDYLEMDESLLTGESRTVRKRSGERIYSGSFCVAGEGTYRVDAFGQDSFASQMLASARRHVDKKTPLQMETNTITVMLMVLAAVYIVFNIVYTLIFGRSADDWVGKLLEDSAVILDIVPIALFLLIVITYMIAAIRMADTGVLLQNSSSVESISHVDTICMDKTGTITTNRLRFREEVPLGDDDVRDTVAKYLGSSGSVNRTYEALKDQYGAVPCETLQEIRFTSDRKFSAAKFVDSGEVRTVFMGAANVLGPRFEDCPQLEALVSDRSSKGYRTLVMGEHDGDIDIEADGFAIPSLRPIALFVIEDEVRPDCRRIIDEFMEHGTELKVISGDDPVTVDALFRAAGIPGERVIVSGDELSSLQGEEKSERILEANIFGRMRPEQKEEVIDTLKANGRYVAMVGDGVNDVKSLKRANVGIALESGSGAARSVADMVLVKDDFSTLPKAVIEGKRTVSGMRDILKIYISRNITMAILIAMTLIVLGSTPFNPIQNVYYALLSVSGSAFFMAIWARPSDNSDLILPAVLRYVLPTAVSIAVMGLAVFAAAGILLDNGIISIAADGSMWNDPTRHIDEAYASGLSVLFLTLCGILQLLVVVPYFRIFSADGSRSDDFKPMVLMVLLLVLAFACYNVDVVVNLMSIPRIPVEQQLLMLALAVVWLGVQRALLKWKALDRIDVIVQKVYRHALERNRRKEAEAERAASQ